MSPGMSLPREKGRRRMILRIVKQDISGYNTGYMAACRDKGTEKVFMEIT